VDEFPSFVFLVVGVGMMNTDFFLFSKGTNHRSLRQLDNISTDLHLRRDIYRCRFHCAFVTFRASRQNFSLKKRINLMMDNDSI